MSGNDEVKNLKTEMGIPTGDFDEEKTSAEKTLDNIAERMSYSDELDRLMQMAVISPEERRKLAILYAVKKVPMINSSTLHNYMFATLSLSISVKGVGRDQLLEVAKASVQQIPLSILQRVKGKMGFE